ncbi:FAD/NAD(P)-binding protein [Arenibacterium halophilum]|uniref:FAD-dependent urate hydroxylase HpyO/Asp monooxygenase CreE-like FAD/NAD(P)-binding domain-containing protein n=1 Tax=Arenibacterium halophilum TaxID=2583821 RepID=A0ABY2XEJ2_9RHOB|nr:FAD/NAD(P)-binding domain-containing protein [Arenibacterium halophilum]TMV15121.1 hypothetical protein FGK64_03930 [Arenibacterium halophilum]
MTPRNDIYRVAVIGFGPRGLGAVEALAGLADSTGARVHLDIFDTSDAPGAGPNFDPKETPLCLLNVPVRDVDLPHPIGSFANFSDWLAPENHPDRFPTRSELGRYFIARRDHLCDTLPSGLTIAFHDCDVSHIAPADGRWQVSAGEHATGRYDEVLVTVGQPATQPDDQLAKWQEHAADTGAELAQVYPARDLMQRAETWAGKTVGLRGLGLSTLDALRVLTFGQGGDWRDDRYVPSGREPGLIVPFSLDGQPPAPKPATVQVDAQFDPTDAETEGFRHALDTASNEGADAILANVCEALIAPAARISGAHPDKVAHWLECERNAPGSQETRAPLDALRAGLDGATGRAAPSVGYAVGHVWRKWQNDLRKLFNPAKCLPDTAEALIGFDEGLKRYSYGPPVSAARELLALCEAGLVTLAAADDPDIACTEHGWTLHGDSSAALRIDAMVDTVLPSPKLKAVTGDPVQDLHDAGLLSSVPGVGGTRTAADAQVMRSDGSPVSGLCLLGRLALGSVIAVDSIHDCFGAASHRWAEGVQGRAARAATREPALSS